MTSAVFVPSQNRMYVLLGNVDLTKVDPAGWYTLCGPSKSTIVAIDTTTDMLVSLSGTGPGGGIELDGYNPPINANALVYDAARHRLVVMHAGCNANNDGEPGEMRQRIVESVDLATGKVTTLLDLNDHSFPSTLVYADAGRAAIGFGGQAFFWNPQESKLGNEIPGGLGVFAFDGKDALVGARIPYDEEWNPGPVEIVRVPLSNSATAESVEVLGDPISNDSVWLSSAEIWPLR
jgi:hypothetical protein